MLINRDKKERKKGRREGLQSHSKKTELYEEITIAPHRFKSTWTHTHTHKHTHRERETIPRDLG